MTKRKLESEKVKTGRPTKFTQALADKICELVATTPKGLATICNENPDLPEYQTVHNWLFRNPAFFDKYYNEAKPAQAHAFAEHCMDVANDGEEDILYQPDGKIVLNSVKVLRDRLRVSTMQWAAGKGAPKKYGDLKNQFDEQVNVNDKLREEIRQLREKLDAKYKKEY